MYRIQYSMSLYSMRSKLEASRFNICAAELNIQNEYKKNGSDSKLLPKSDWFVSCSNVWTNKTQFSRV